MVNFRKITEENFDAIISMKRPEGENYVASNAVSLAQAWLYRDNGDVFPCAIYNDDIPVGFMLLEEDMDEEKLLLWRIMFPQEHANRGYGTAAIKLLVHLAKESERYRALYLTYAPDNAIAEHVYYKLGFRPTGEMEHGELEMRLTL